MNPHLLAIFAATRPSQKAAHIEKTRSISAPVPASGNRASLTNFRKAVPR